MAKPYFALNLDFVGKPCLVIGGPEFATFSQSVAEQRECQIEKGRTPKERKYRFNQQLRELDIQGRIVYPTEYVKNLKYGVEQRADGLWWRKDKPKTLWQKIF